MYKLFKQLANREFIHVDSYDGLEEALQHMEGFNVTWPGEYVVRDVKGNDLSQIVELGLSPTRHYQPILPFRKRST
jgi:hypothetical protein